MSAREFDYAEMYLKGKKRVIFQSIYGGNRVASRIAEDEVDCYLMGWICKSDKLPERAVKDLNRTIIRIPNTENLVILYNKNREERDKETMKRFGKDRKPLVVIPELNFKLHSPCIACRINEDGTVADIENGDFEILKKYLAE